MPPKAARCQSRMALMFPIYEGIGGVGYIKCETLAVGLGSGRSRLKCMWLSSEMCSYVGALCACFGQRSALHFIGLQRPHRFFRSCWDSLSMAERWPGHAHADHNVRAQQEIPFPAFPWPRKCTGARDSLITHRLFQGPCGKSLTGNVSNVHCVIGRSTSFLQHRLSNLVDPF